MLVNDLEQGAANAQLLVGRQDKHLGDSQGSLGHLLELIVGGRVAYELIVHVYEEVIP